MDSGFGALSYLPELNRQLPGVSLTAFADHEFFPYGEKSEQAIVDRLLEMAGRMVHLTRPGTILIACNTASTIVLPKLRDSFDIPIVGVVPAVKPAVSLSKTGKIALLATPGTVSRDYIDQLIDKYASTCEVIKVACPRLASIAEAKLTGQFVQTSAIEHELEPLLNHPLYQGVDTLIFGCTHFTFLKEEITRIVARDIALLDPVGSVSKQVVKVNKSRQNNNAQNTLILSASSYNYDNFDFSVCRLDSLLFL